MTFRSRFGCMLLASLVIMPFTAEAQYYPDRAVRVVVTFAPGGAPDVVARAIAAQVEIQLKQSLIIDNRAGANGIIGTQAVAHAPADGYTLLHASASFVVNPSIYKKLPYDIWKDFAPIANLGIGVGYLLLVNYSLPVKDTAEFIAYAKKNQIAYGSPGAGNTLHLASELFNVKAGIAMQHVPFRGTAPALNALLAGTIQAMFIPPAAALAYVESGQLRAIGFAGDIALKELPNVPLIKHTVPEFRVEGAWHGWFAPAKTPMDIVDRTQRRGTQSVEGAEGARFCAACRIRAGRQVADRISRVLAGGIRSLCGSGPRCASRIAVISKGGD